MKRFGVQLTAGAVTILLGALAAAQAQKDHQSTSDSDWEVPEMPAMSQSPVPMGLASADGGGMSPPRIAGDSFDRPATFGDNDSASQALLASMQPQTQTQFKPAGEAPLDAGGVQQVQHIEDMPGAAPMTFATPPAGLASQDEMPASPAMDMPVLEMNGGGPPASSISMPETASAPATNLPTMQFENPPGALAGVPDAAGIDAQPNVLRSGPSTFSAPPVDAPLSSAGIPSPLSESAAPLVAGGLSPAPVANDYVTADASNALRGGGSSAFSSLPQLPAAAPQSSVDQYSASQYDSASQYGDPSPGSAGQISSSSSRSANQATSPNQFGGGYQDGPGSYADQRNVSNQQFSAPGFAGQDAGFAGQNMGGSLAGSRSGYGSGPRVQPASAELSSTIASPGDRRLEGVQSPSVVIHKRAPREVKVGKVATFVIEVKNVGSAEALGVTVHDHVPAGMRLQDATPKPEFSNNQLFWQLGALPVGEERTITMQLIPEQEGELGSVARVTFEAAASVRTVSTRPEVRIKQTAPATVLIGQQLEIELEISNPGSGEATNVVVEADVPAGMKHPKGHELDNQIGSLAPRETRRETLRMSAVAPGMIRSTVRILADDGLEHTHSVDVEVISPELHVGVAGPGRRFLERQAEYEVQIHNSGTADATNVEFKTMLDRGLSFVSAGNEGVYDPAQHAVYWAVERLPAGEQASVPLTLLPIEEGEQAIRSEVVADLNQSNKGESRVSVESLSELTFEISDSADPIELGAESTYEIRVANSGSRDDGNIRVMLEFPRGIEATSSENDPDVDQAGRLIFPVKQRLRAGEDFVLRVKAKGMAPGRHLIKATVVSEQSNVEVVKEESTMVYSDR